MITIRRLPLLMLLTLLVVEIVGCETGTDQIPIPTRGPVEGSAGGSSEASMQVNSSTNCVEPGDTVEFTLIIKNTTNRVMTLTGNPLLEMTIQSLYYPDLPTQYWSQSSNYPTKIDPVFKPLEERTYYWHWKAEAIYAPNPIARNGIMLKSKGTSYIDGFSNPFFMDSQLGIGVKSFGSGGGVGQVTVLCRDMK